MASAPNKPLRRAEARRPKTCVASIVAGALLLAGSPSFGFELAWKKGWNLVTLSAPSDLGSFPDGVHLWPLPTPEQNPPPIETSHLTKHQISGEIGAGPLWLRADGPGQVSLVPASRLWPGDKLERRLGWNVVSVAETSSFEDPSIRALYRWHAQDETYVSLSVGTTLRPGVAYFAYTEEPGAAFFAETCLPKETWSWDDAVRVLAVCPFSSDSAAVVPRWAWTHRTPRNPENESATKSRLVLHHTATAPDETPQMLEDFWLLKRGTTIFPYHFVIAQDEAGSWEIFEGAFMPHPVPKEIHIAVMGTYAPLDLTNLEQTPLGFLPEDDEAQKQPPLPAVIRLGELVASLGTMHDTIHGFGAFGSTTHIPQGEKITAWPAGLVHLAQAANSRFFADTSTITTDGMPKLLASTDKTEPKETFDDVGRETDQTTAGIDSAGGDAPERSGRTALPSFEEEYTTGGDAHSWLERNALSSHETNSVEQAMHPSGDITPGFENLPWAREQAVHLSGDSTGILEGKRLSGLAETTVLWRDNIDGPSDGSGIYTGGALATLQSPGAAYVVQDNVEGNMKKALALRDALRKSTTRGAPRPHWVQTEYQPRSTEGPPSGAEEAVGPNANPDDHDAQFLARFERVWVYTQGIALHQAARRKENAEAQGLARWLCDKENAVWEGGVILGWPFSKNTKEDTWSDARLVTGANAWAVHGLGAFLLSEAFSTLDDREQTDLRHCYQAALTGLKAHRVAVKISDGTTKGHLSECANDKDCAYLMTAGWTTQGLVFSEVPWKLGLTEDRSEQWAYYSVLDAMGYPNYDDTQPPQVKRTATDTEGRRVEREALTLNASQFKVLGVRTQAQNVVTEHNVDVLSVLNHALGHVDQIWPNEDEVSQSERRLALRAWRDGLRDGIFALLWDAPEGGHAVDEKQPNSCRPETKTIQWQGRVITGGSFDTNRRWVASSHVAIDNCSWLALSVDYDNLPQNYVAQLEACLTYTVQKFADTIPYEEGNQCYYGTHYFPNTFRDPYIEKNDRQELSYHLEATTGLIFGLHRFYEAHPAQGARYEAQARALWTGVQAFVRDHGFPYSSQRIQDLSTRLASSTAAIWYLDVYDALENQGGGGENRPLKNYAAHVDTRAVIDGVELSWTRLKALTYEEAPSPEGYLAVDPPYSQFGHVRPWSGIAVLPQDADPKAYSVRLPEPYTIETPSEPESEESPLRLKDTPVNATDIRLVFEDLRLSRRAGVPPRAERVGQVRGAVDVTALEEPGQTYILLSKLEGKNAYAGDGTEDTMTETRIGIANLDPKTGLFSWPHEVGILEGGVPIARLVVSGDTLSILAATSVLPERVEKDREVYEGKHSQFVLHRPLAPHATLNLVHTARGAEEKTIRTAALAQASLHLVVTDVVDGVPRTSIEDQALAILAAVSRHDFETAGLWASGLLHTIVRTSGPHDEEDWRFPASVYTRTGVPLPGEFSLEAEMLATYALARFYALHPGRDEGPRTLSGRLQGEIYDALGQVLKSLARRVERGASNEAWISAPVETGTEKRALAIHQVLAYFTLRQAEDIGLLSSGGVDSSALSATLLTYFWNEAGLYPWTTIPATEERAPSRGTRALYSLFAYAAGDVAKAKASLYAGTLAPEASPQTELEEISPVPGQAHRFFESHSLWILALRQAAARDPRLEDIALVEFERHVATLAKAESPSPGRYAALVLAHSPQGFFGSNPGPNLTGTLISEPSQVPAGILTARLVGLEAAYIETLAALLASEILPDLFDALIIQLTLFRFAEHMLETHTPTARWIDALEPLESNSHHRLFSDRVRETVTELRTLCEEPSPLQSRRDNIERLVGLQCETFVGAFEALLVRRGGTEDADMGVLVSTSRYGRASTSHHLALTRLIAWLGEDGRPQRHRAQPVAYAAQDAIFGHGGSPGFLSNAGRTWYAPVLGSPLEFPNETPTLFALRTALRARLKQAVSETIAPFRTASTPSTAYYDLQGVDGIAALHPESPHYWQRTALELRAFHEAKDQSPSEDGFMWLLGGAPAVTPEDPISPARWKTQRVFRQFVNRYAAGHLPELAKKSGFSLLFLHHVLQSGEIEPRAFRHLTSTVVRDEAHITDWTSKLFGPNAEGTDSGGLMPVGLEPKPDHNRNPNAWGAWFSLAFAEPDVAPGTETPWALLGAKPELMGYKPFGARVCKTARSKRGPPTDPCRARPYRSICRRNRRHSRRRNRCFRGSSFRERESQRGGGGRRCALYRTSGL